MEMIHKVGTNPSTRAREKLLVYSYENYCEGIERLAKQITKKPDFFCGVYRGGLVPAVHLSYKLSVPLMAIDWRSPKSVDSVRGLLTNSKVNVIMVDEIIDSGRTVRLVNELFSRDFKWACLILNTAVQEIPNEIIYHETIDRTKTTDYVIFHWDSD